ncbi:MAG TPA: glycoside hydrolase family 20 zincin-like fold domain-containing protein, partial [Saprospiraceae bacterium]|nr:glycoside hydrolase family 20 zincin-like fold domain-containing protein [Saprospiraceae bacterium]
MRGLPVILWLSLSLSTLVAQPFQFLPELKSITYQEGELFLAKPDFGYSFEGKPSPNNQVALAQCHVVLDAFRTISPVPSGKGQAKLIIAKSGQNKHLDSEFAGELEEIGDQGYVIKVDIKHITVLANTDQGIFYAMVTLKQLLQQNKRLLIPCLTIVDYPTIKVRVWQDDISRGPIP